MNTHSIHSSMTSARGDSAGMQRSDSLGDIVAPPLQQQADQAAGQGSDQRADQAASAIWQWFRLLVERLAALVPWDDLWRGVLARVLDSDGQVGLLNMVDGRRTRSVSFSPGGFRRSIVCALKARFSRW